MREGFDISLCSEDLFSDKKCNFDLLVGGVLRQLQPSKRGNPASMEEQGRTRCSGEPHFMPREKDRMCERASKSADSACEHGRV